MNVQPVFSLVAGGVVPVSTEYELSERKTITTLFVQNNYVHYYFLRVFAVETVLGGCSYPSKNTLTIKPHPLFRSSNCVANFERMFKWTQ